MKFEEITRETPGGSISWIDLFGDELTIVNAARVSFGVEKKVLDDRDRRLIHYLVKHEHSSPFRHVFFRFKIYAPEFVMRQWYKHVVGAEWTSTHPSQLHGWSEISGRYVPMDEIYTPKKWRLQSKDNKQGSDGLLPDTEQMICSTLYSECMGVIQDTYQKLLEHGVAKEQARLLLPMSTLTSVVWTCSLQTVLHFIRLRCDPHAQEEIREYAAILEEWVQTYFPTTWDAFHSNLYQK